MKLGNHAKWEVKLPVVNELIAQMLSYSGGLGEVTGDTITPPSHQRDLRIYLHGGSAYYREELGLGMPELPQVLLGSLAACALASMLILGFQSAFNLTSESSALASAPLEHKPIGFAKPPTSAPALSSKFGAVRADITVGQDPSGLAEDSATGDMYVFDPMSDNVSILSNTALVATVGVWGIGGQAAPLFDPADGYVYAPELTDQLNIVSGSTLKWTGQIGSAPTAATYDAVDGDVYIADMGSANVSIVSGTNVTGSIPVAGAESSPHAILFDGLNGDIYVADSDCPGIPCIAKGGNLSVLSGASTSSTLFVGTGSHPWALACDSSNGYVYIANYGSHNVSIVSGSRFVGSVQVGSLPENLLFNPANGDVYVANYNSSNVSVISGTAVVGTISTGTEPSQMAYDPDNGYVYVTNFGSTFLSVLSGTTNVGSVQVGLADSEIVYDASNKYLYATGPACDGVGCIDSIVSVISPTTASGPTISSFAATPSTVAAGQVTTFTVSANGGNGTMSYNYAGLPLGCTSANTASLTCTPNTMGSYTVRIYVNDSAGHSANATTSLVVTPALASVAVTPYVDYLQAETSVVFTATPTCNGGACPSSITYVWAWSNTLGSLNSTTGKSVNFTAGSLTGTVVLRVNATLDGMTKNSMTTIIITTTPVPTLTSVAMSPPSLSVIIGATQTFTAMPACNGGACPAGTIYAWKLSSNLGNMSSTTGSSTVFTAGSKTGTMTLTVEATLFGRSAWSNATITIEAKSSGSSGILGLPGYEGYILIGVVVATVVALVMMLLLRKRKGAQPAPSPATPSPVKAGASPQQSVGPLSGRSPFDPARGVVGPEMAETLFQAPSYEAGVSK